MDKVDCGFESHRGRYCFIFYPAFNFFIWKRKRKFPPNPVYYSWAAIRGFLPPPSEAQTIPDLNGQVPWTWRATYVTGWHVVHIGRLKPVYIFNLHYTTSDDRSVTPVTSINKYRYNQSIVDAHVNVLPTHPIKSRSMKRRRQLFFRILENRSMMKCQRQLMCEGLLPLCHKNFMIRMYS